MTEDGASLLWVIGRGGQLGRAVAAASRIDIFRHEPIDWTTDAPSRLARCAETFLEEARGRTWQIAWCAGAGVIGTGEDALTAETTSLRVVLETVADRSDRGTMMLASSAGGIYGGNRKTPLTEYSLTAPLSPYGQNKLVQERIVRDWVERSGNRAIVARISNLYGPAQSLSKPQGLISQICLATILRQPASIYVSLDTIRDYLFASDAASIIVDCLERTTTTEPGSVTTKIVASMRSLSIGGILGEVRRVIGRRPTVVMVASPVSSHQGVALNFRSEVWRDLDERSLTTMPHGIDRVAASIRERIAVGDLRAHGPAS